MHIENYKGFDITHNAEKDQFETKIQKQLPGSHKKEFIVSGRLQKLRYEIDAFLQTAAKIPVLKKAWMRNSDRYETNKFTKVTILVYNKLGHSVMVETADGKIESHRIGNDRFGNKDFYLCCKENDQIIGAIHKKIDELTKMKKELGSSAGKLVPLTIEHFK